MITIFKKEAEANVTLFENEYRQLYIISKRNKRDTEEIDNKGV